LNYFENLFTYTIYIVCSADYNNDIKGATTESQPKLDFIKTSLCTSKFLDGNIRVNSTHPLKRSPFMRDGRLVRNTGPASSNESHQMTSWQRWNEQLLVGAGSSADGVSQVLMLLLLAAPPLVVGPTGFCTS
jgi:hypothetical protein